MPFSSLISQSKCSTWSQVMFRWGWTPDQVSKPPATADWIQPPKFNPQKCYQVSSVNGYSKWKQEITLQTMLLSILMALVFYQLIWLEAVLGFFWGALKFVRGCCVSVHRHSHSGLNYWDRNLWSLSTLRTASSMREGGTSKTSAVRWHQGLIMCFTLSRYFIAQIAIWTRDDVTHHQHRENWSERCWAVHWSLHHSQCKG